MPKLDKVQPEERRAFHTHILFALKSTIAADFGIGVPMAVAII